MAVRSWEAETMTASNIHIGIYSIPEAARLTGLGESRVRRWLTGYSYTAAGAKRKARPVWSGQLAPIRGRRAVSFRDLIEMKFVDAFLRSGVSWKTIRDVQELARQQFHFDHPFSTNRFRNDGRHLVMTVLQGDHQASLFDLSTRQQSFLEAADPFREELEMNEHDAVCRWWPMGRQRYVVLDPTRMGGRPIAARSGVPVEVLAGAAASGLAADEVAATYDCQIEEVTDALAFVAPAEAAP